MALSVHPFKRDVLSENEHDPEDRERFEWTEDDDTTYWPNAAGVIEELKAQIKAGGASVTLDLNEVILSTWM